MGSRPHSLATSEQVLPRSLLGLIPPGALLGDSPSVCHLRDPEAQRGFSNSHRCLGTAGVSLCPHSNLARLVAPLLSFCTNPGSLCGRPLLCMYLGLARFLCSSCSPPGTSMIVLRVPGWGDLMWLLIPLRELGLNKDCEDPMSKLDTHHGPCR